jgi:hypothetical protein
MTSQDLGYDADPMVPYLVEAGTPGVMMVVLPGAAAIPKMSRRKLGPPHLGPHRKN